MSEKRLQTRDELIIGIPSKGRLLGGCEDLLKATGFRYQRYGREMVTMAEFDQNQRVKLALMRPEDLLKRVIKGDIDVGVIGSDRIFEAYPNFYDKFVTDRPEGLKTSPLSFGQCKMVIAVPEDYPARWGVDTLSTLATKRVGTSYPKTARGFFLDRAILEVKIEEADGAVEGMIALGWVDAIADLVETGRSLKENGLRELTTISRVRAMLVYNLDTPVSRKVSSQLYSVIEKLKDANKQIAEQQVGR